MATTFRKKDIISLKVIPGGGAASASLGLFRLSVRIGPGYYSLSSLSVPIASDLIVLTASREPTFHVPLMCDSAYCRIDKNQRSSFQQSDYFGRGCSTCSAGNLLLNDISSRGIKSLPEAFHIPSLVSPLFFNLKPFLLGIALS